MLVDGESAIKGEVELDEMSLSSRSRDLCNVEVESRIECTRAGAISTSNTVTVSRVRFVFVVEFASFHIDLVEPDSGLVEMVNCSFRSKHAEPAEARLQAQIPFHIIRITSGRCVRDGCCVEDVALSVAAICIASPIQFVVSSCAFCNLATSNPLIDVTGSGEISASHLELANATISKRGLSLLSCSGVRSPMILNNCSIKNSAQDNSRGMLITFCNCSDAVIDSCLLDGNSSECDTKESQRRLSNKVFNEAENEICRWNGSIVDFSSSSVMMKDTTICNSSKGGMTVSGGSVGIEMGLFENNNPSIANYPSLRRNIICSDSGTLNVMSLKGGDGWERNTSLWMLNEGCELSGIVSERVSLFFVPVLESVEEKEKGEEMEVVFKGKLLLPCNLSFIVVKQMGDEKQIEKYEFDESGYVSETEVGGRLKREIIREAGEEAEVRVSILFGDRNNPSSTDSFILKNRSEPKANGDEKIVEGGKEGKSYWLLIVCIVIVVILLVIVVILAVRWRKVKERNEELQEIVNDNIRKDPKAFEMVTMEMSPETQWRRAEREAEKKNEERMKKRIYEKSLGHSESSEHLLSESGSTEYILGRDSDKIPEWALEKVDDEEEIRKRTQSPSISSTSTTDSDSTFVRSEKMRKKEMAIGSLQEREMTAAQILFWVANLALHSFDEMDNPLQSLDNLSPHIVLFSEHMVICIVMHSDLLSDNSDSSSISSSTVVTSASGDDDEDSLPSSAFEDEDSFKKECLRWKAPELQINKKMGVTKKSVVFSIGMMLWECLTLQIPFGDYEAEVAGQKIVNGELPNIGVVECEWGREFVKKCVLGDLTERPTLTDVKRWLIGHFPEEVTVKTMSYTIGIAAESIGKSALSEHFCVLCVKMGQISEANVNANL
ncbi:uncharacterized protein MONOS_17342 [Monocercomonoides exilis]|uniref:uncharacterized protein n=1 Tax=Monocercomonoides exilis TaxID=2049356 RepID=UPI00355AB5A0|nr:hypothetical protein MONOS_17342 [Monocercomonoides exilis]